MNFLTIDVARHMHISTLPAYKSIIVLDGDIPSLKLIQYIKSTTPIIAADGAAAKLIKHDITPTYVVGDLDSLDCVYGLSDITKYHDVDQDTCDFEKSIDFARKHRLTPALIVGVSGGEIDHTLNNIDALVKHHLKDGELFFIDHDKQERAKLGIVLTASRSFLCPVGSTVSIFPCPQAIVSSTGLLYPLERANIMRAAGVLCARNKTITEEVGLILHDGIVLVILDLSLPIPHN